MWENEFQITMHRPHGFVFQIKLNETVNFRAKSIPVLHFWNRNCVRKVDGFPLATHADVDFYRRQQADFPASAGPSSVIVDKPGPDGRTFPHVLSRIDVLCLSTSKVWHIFIIILYIEHSCHIIQLSLITGLSCCTMANRRSCHCTHYYI